uniref:Transmembrane protein n=1 Tax=Peronospora matthiolae TaxID=2874970 RepID=A0AAV1TW85_9STRA
MMADGAEALRTMETHAIREAQRATYTSNLGSMALVTASLLWLTLPPLWSVVNGEWSSSIGRCLLALTGHGLFVLSMLVVLRVAQVQGEELLIQFNAKYLARVTKPKAVAPASLDRTAQLEEVTKLNVVRGLLSNKTDSFDGVRREQEQRSLFDPAPVRTVEDGKAYLRRIQKARKHKEAEESMQPAYGIENSYQSDAYGIYGNASMVPRVYQASGFDPYLRDVSIGNDDEDPLRTSSLPHIAWQQLEEWGLATFMHLYCRNIRRLLAYHVKDVVEAFLENASALNECGVMADVLLRRVPSQALLCPPGQTNQMTNVSLSDMLHNLAKSPLFFSKERGVFLFEEHQSFEKYLNVGNPSSTDYSSLERQQYVLERLIMLSKDRSLDRFRWNKGAAWKGKEWTENLPTDAEILMNTFCCLMDNMLPADNERDRPFWKSYYFSKGPSRPFTPRVRSRLFLVQTVGRPPHFKALVKGAVREIVPGEENCFHAIVVYLHAVKKMKAGYLESINLHRIIEQVFDVSK